MQITIQNSERTKKAIITRVKLSDGYNYYYTIYSLNAHNHLVINEGYKQKESIYSKREAIEIAESLL